MKRFLAVVLALICWPVLAAEAPLTLVLTAVPDNTPADATIYVAGPFNNWTPDNPAYRLAKDPDGHYAITFPASGKVAFKFTLGSWNARELDGKGGNVENRVFEMPASGPATYSGTVAEWNLPARNIEDLQARLEKILADTHTPGAIVALADRAGTQWAAGLGLADVAAERPATVDTLFRIGSVSKAFAGMAILKLADEGKLSLQDSVHKLVPDVWFENPWEATDPVRVVDLMEHTTGWDDMHLAEYHKNAEGMSLKEGLDFYKGSRISRWKPGTRWSYCNSGPAVAAYIVEKITGQRFEDYVTQNIFLPLGMKSATYFKPDGGQAATLYHQDGKTPFPYWHILLRPAGAINASASDLAAYLGFYLRRGAPVLPAADVERMEAPQRDWAAQQGLKLGYGLYDMSTVEDGQVWQGHGGGVEGGLTYVSYLPEQGVGYAFSINSGNGDAFQKIQREIRAYVTRDIARLPLPPAGAFPKDAADYEGWYEPVSTRNGQMYFFEKLMGLHRFRLADGALVSKGFIGAPTKLIPVTGELFRNQDSPVADTVLLTPNDEGRFIQSEYGTWRRLPTAMAWLELGLTALVALALVSILLYAPFWIIASLRKKWRRPDEVSIKLIPLMGVIGYALVPISLMTAGQDLISRLGAPTLWSIGLFIATCLIGLVPLAGLVALWQSRRTARRWVWRYSAFVIAMFLIAAGYLAYWGAIGLMTWA